MKKTISVLLSIALIISLLPLYAFAEEITSISYTPSSEIIRYFEVGGFFERDESDTEYYCYNAVQRSEGDIFTVNYSSGKSVDYVLVFDPDPKYISTIDPEDILYENEVDMYHMQRDEHYHLGNDNKLYVRYGGKECFINVSIVENPIKSIVYTPVSNIVIYENADGEWRSDGEIEYFDYHNPRFKAGDKLDITYSDTNTTVVYTYLNYFDSENYIQYIGFYDSEFNELPDSWELFTSRNGEWSRGSDNYMCVRYKDNESNYVQVTVEPNPVKAIIYDREIDVEFFENSNMYYGETDDCYYYDFPYHLEGDKLTVIDNNDINTVYEYSSEDSTFISSDGKVIPDSDVHLFSKQNEKPWEIGENEYYAEYMGSIYTLTATVNENPVKAIRFLPKNMPTVMQGKDEHYDENSGSVIYDLPDFCVGDTLVVIDRDGNEKSYIAQLHGYNNIVFVSSGGEEISEYDIFLDSEQYEKPWSIGKDNEFTIGYMGAKCTVNCEVVENPIESIEFVPLNTAKYIKNTNGYYFETLDRYLYNYPNIQNGDKLIVNYADVARGKVEYTAVFDVETKEMTFVSDGDIIVLNEMFDIISDQLDNPWTVGENTYWISYCGKLAPVTVIIAENNITDISFKPVALPQIFESDYSLDTDDKTGDQYKHYNIPRFKEGDILTLKFDDDTSRDYVLTFDVTDGELYFINGGEKYHIYSLMVTDNQAENGWALGRGNYYTIDFCGFTTDVEVEIIESDVKSIVFTPKNKIVIEENTDGEYLYDEFDEEFYFYNNIRIVNLGDTLTVNYYNGDTIDYIISDNDTGDNWILRSENGETLDTDEVYLDDHQWEKHWKPGINHFEIKYHGAVCSVPITIKGAYIPGDINGDGSVNNKDLTRLFQYLSDWDVEVNESALDINGDGSVNNKDLTRLFQYLSDWDVEIF